MEVGEKVHEDALIWDLKVIKVETWRAPIMTTTSWFPLLRYGAKKGEVHVNCVFAKLMTGQQVMDFKQISWHIDLNQRLI